MWRLRHKQPCYSLQFYRKSQFIATPGMGIANCCIYDNLKLTKKSSVLWLCELQSLISPTCQNSPPGRGLKQLPRWWRIVIPAATPPVISSNVPISFYIRACGRACALTWLDFLSTTSSAGERSGGNTAAAGESSSAAFLPSGVQLCCTPRFFWVGLGKHEYREVVYI